VRAWVVLQLTSADMYVDRVFPVTEAEMTSSSTTVDDHDLLFAGPAYQMHALEAFVCNCIYRLCMYRRAIIRYTYVG